MRAKRRPYHGILSSGVYLSYYAVYCRRRSTLGSQSPNPSYVQSYFSQQNTKVILSVGQNESNLWQVFKKVAWPPPQIPDNFLPVPKHTGYCASEMGSLWTKGIEPKKEN